MTLTIWPKKPGYTGQMYQAVMKEIEAFYGRYGASEGISIQTAKKRISKAEGKATQERINKLKNSSGARAKKELRMLEATMHISRLESLKANIGCDIIKGYDELERRYGQILKERTTQEIRRRAQELGLREAHLQYDKITEKPMGSANYLDRLWMNQDYFRADIEKAIKQALIGGKDIDELAKEIKKKFGGEEYQARRLLRTEIKRVQTEASKALMQENGIKYYKFTTMDSKACDACKTMNGRRYKVENMQPGVTAPPIHPNCRCSTIPWGMGWYKWNQGGGVENLKNQSSGLISSKRNNKINNKITSQGKAVNPMPSDEYYHWRDVLQKHGVSVWPMISGDDLRYMQTMGIEGSYRSGNISHVGAIPSRGTMLEEIIHWTQARKYGELCESDLIERDAREIEANRKLLKYHKAYRLDEYDIEDIKKNLEGWENSFKARTGVSYDQSNYRDSL